MHFLNNLLKYIKSNVFVESGTYQGDTVQFMLDNTKCDNIISLELSDVFFLNCEKRFLNEKRVKLYHADSKTQLYDIIKDIDVSMTFWLDGIGSNVNCIDHILFELEQIKKHHINRHIIIINDINLIKENDVKNEQIIDKINDINPLYEFVYYNDNNILMATFPQKICIQKYILKLQTNPQPPGFADFLRGVMTLYQYCDKYGYDLYIDGIIHPIFKFFKQNEHYLKHEVTGDVAEVIPPMTYDEIDDLLKKMFLDGNDLMMITNAFYRNSREDKYITNFNAEGTNKMQDNKTKKFIRDLLIPSSIVEDKINKIFDENYKLKKNDEYNIIHVRSGDEYIYDNELLNTGLFHYTHDKLIQLFQTFPHEKFILITDSNKMGQELTKYFPQLLYWNNNKIHAGVLINDKNCNNIECEDIMHVVVDFLIISRAKNIFSNGIGFARCVATIFDINFCFL